MRLFRGELVEDLPDGKVADPFVMALVRYHARSPQDEADLLAFLRAPGFQKVHLEMLLKRLGPCLPLLASRIEVTTWEGGRMLKCNALSLPNGVRWRDGTMSCDNNPLPDSVAVSIEGRRLGDVIQHPYLPAHLVIDWFEQAGARWSVRFRAQTKRDARQATRRNERNGGQ